MEMLSVISFLLFFKRRFHSNIPFEIYLLSFIPFLGILFKTLFVLFIPVILYILFKRKEIFFVSLLFLSFSLFSMSLSSRIYPLYPISKFYISYNLNKNVHILISSILIYLGYSGKKMFLDERFTVLFLFLLIPAFFIEKKDFYYPEDLYNNPLKNRSYVCVVGDLESKKIKIGGEIYYFSRVCRKACVYFYLKEKVQDHDKLVCGYLVYRNGKIYLKYPSLLDHEDLE